MALPTDVESIGSFGSEARSVASRATTPRNGVRVRDVTRVEGAAPLGGLRSAQLGLRRVRTFVGLAFITGYAIDGSQVHFDGELFVPAREDGVRLAHEGKISI